MAITEDASAPIAVHVTTTSGTTASFTPPSQSLLVVMVAADGGNVATTATVSDSGSHSWSLLKRQNSTAVGALGGTAEVWCTYLSSAPGSITVTASGWSTVGGNIVTKVLLGAAQTQNGATGGNGGASVAPTATLTPTQIGSRIYGAALDFTTNAVLTANGNSSSIDQFNDATNGDTWAAFKGAADTTTLTSTTYGFTNANAAYNVAIAEILAAVSGGSTTEPLIVSQAWTPATTRPALSANFPLGNPAVPTPGPKVVSPQPGIVPVPGAKLFAAPVQPGAPGPLLVSPPFAWPYIPPVLLSESQPLGNPAAGSPGPLVVSTPWAAKVPGALLFGPGAPPAVVSTVATPGPLVVGPPFTPVPIPVNYISASQPLGNPAIGTPQPLVVSTFTLAPVPGAKVFANPAAPAVVAVPTPSALVVGPPWQPVPIPRTILSWSSPLGRPAVPTPQPMVVSPPQRWPVWTASLVTLSPVFVAHSCVTPRPNSGTTTYATATTARPTGGTTAYNTAITARPDSGQTQDPC